MMALPIRSQVTLVGVLVCIAFLSILSIANNLAFAQQVILNEDFESYAPDTFPGSADFFAKSSVAVLPADFDSDKDVDGNDFLIWQRGFGVGTTKAQGDANASGTVDEVDLGIWQAGYGKGDPANVVVTGGAFADPFDPGNNQSMLLHNPNGTSQMGVTWTDEFDDDPNTFRNGSIEFDVWMDSPDPDAFWTFMSLRVGHGGIDRSGSTGAATDTTIWNTFRMQNNPAMGSSDVLEQITDPGHRITFGSEATYLDDNSSPSAGAFGPDQLFHVRYELEENGYTLADLPTYRLFVDGNQIDWTGTLVGNSDEHPWVLQPGAVLAPGINMLSFFTDASGFGADPDPGTGNVYIDNLVITNDDLPPLVNNLPVPEPSSCVMLLTIAMAQFSLCRRAGR